MIRRLVALLPRSFRSLFGLLGLLAFLSGCGGGPIVATSTGRILYVATSNGIYGFSIMSTGTLAPISSQPLVTGSSEFLQIAATTGTPFGQNSPILLGADGSGTLSSWSISGGGGLNTTTLPAPVGCTSLTSITGTTPTLDNNYIVVLDGASTNSNIESISLSNGNCTVYSTLTTGVYPIQA
ncbi:MAG: hypothetical protein M0T83_09560, partial [Nitrospiraceae bacterium]|nr:hypothetical protein [Nitrospiraceae bacterium]